MGLLKFYDRVPSKASSVTAGTDTYNITFPLKTIKLQMPNQTLFTHVLVND